MKIIIVQKLFSVKSVSDLNLGTLLLIDAKWSTVLYAQGNIEINP